MTNEKLLDTLHVQPRSLSFSPSSYSEKMHWKRGSGILKYGNRKVITQTNQDSLPNC